MRTRNRALDGLKSVSALLIVSGHVAGEYLSRNGWSAPLGFLFGVAQLGVPTFFVVAGILHGRRLEHAASGDWLGRRAARLLIPYAAWSLLYLLAAFFAARIGISPLPHLQVANVVLLGGAFLTLWFLPAMIYTVLLSWLLLRHLSPRAAFFLAVAVAAIDALPWITSLSLPLDLGLWLAIYLAGVWVGSGPASPRVTILTVLAGSMVLLAVCGGFYAAGAPGVRWVDLAVKLGASAAALLLAALALRRSDTRILSLLSPGAPLLLGIYLVHPLVERVISKSWPAAGAPAAIWFPSVFVLTAGVSSAVVSGLLRVPGVRLIVE